MKMKSGMLAAALGLMAASPPGAARDGAVLRVSGESQEQDRIIEVRARVRHTTVIVLPPTENILDFVVGDSEYWHLTGAANLAFLKPLATGRQTNIALICTSGTIYSFLVAERGGEDNHLIVRVEPKAEESSPLVSTAHNPSFVSRAEVAAYQEMAQQATQASRTAKEDAEARVSQVQQQAKEEMERYRSDYSTRLIFPYRLQRKAFEWPFLVTAMWSDGQFTYLRSRAQESPALYEIKEGQPSLVAYDLTQNGLYIARRLLGDGWLQIGKEKVQWRFTPPSPLP